MKKSTILFAIICLSAARYGLFTTTVFAQTNFSAETKKFIAFNDPVTVFTNALLT